MVELGSVDKMVRGWGLQLEITDAEDTLQHLIWQCQTKAEFVEKCTFIFNKPPTVVVWTENLRSVTIHYNKQQTISASI